MLRARGSRREDALNLVDVESAVRDTAGADPEREALLADAAGEAMHVVLERLAPAERVAFVLHDLFAMPFDEIAMILGRTPAATKQLASRARRRVRGIEPIAQPAADHREIVRAFLAAAREGRIAELLAVLAPDVVLRADAAAIAMGAEPEVVGAAKVTETFAGRAKFARLALVDGAMGAVWAPGGKVRVWFTFRFEGEWISEIGLVADPERLGSLDVTDLDDRLR